MAQNRDRWKRALTALINNLNDQIDDINDDEAADIERYEKLGKSGIALASSATATYEERRHKIERFRFHVENKLDQVCAMSDAEEFLSRADLFEKAITELLPDYRNKLDWFDGNKISFETCYIMRKQLFKKYVSELFEIYEYIWTYSKTAYPTQQTTSEPLPWRYPGFLGERFLPFFIAMNACAPIHVPLVILE